VASFLAFNKFSLYNLHKDKKSFENKRRYDKMSLLDGIREKVTASLSEWIKISDPKSNWTIEEFAKINYNESLIIPHCVDCIIVNQCWFKNEENKKPDEFDYSKCPEIPLEKRGLYHPDCHDKKITISNPKPNDIIVFDLERRMDYLFNKKKNWIVAMGYNEEEKNEVFQLLEKLSKESYCQGNYKNNPPSDEKKKYGFRIRINLQFPGKREKLGKIYQITSSYIVYPNGKLKNNTPIGGWN